MLDFGFRLPAALDNRPMRFDEFLRIQPQTVYVSATPGDWEYERVKSQAVKGLGLPAQAGFGVRERASPLGRFAFDL